jgi:phage-related tail fiber protein
MTYIVQEILSPSASLNAQIQGVFSVGPNLTLLVTGSGSDTNATIDLAPVASLTPGVYNQVNIDQEGRVISADSINYLVENQTITLSGDASGSGTTSIVVTLPTTGVPAGTYTKVTVDTKGRVISATNLGYNDVVTALGYTPVNSNLLGVADGVATLDSNGNLTLSQLPPTIDLGGF